MAVAIILLLNIAFIIFANQVLQILLNVSWWEYARQRHW